MRQGRRKKRGVESTILSPSLTLDPDPTARPSPSLSPSPSPSPSPKMVRYRECQRNHAAHLGGHVVDGCGEFMPAGEEGTPLALKCAACDCHRNFHRRQVEADPPPPPPPPHQTTTANCYNISFTDPQKSPNLRLYPPPITRTSHLVQHRTPVMMAFGAAAESSSEDLRAAVAVVEGQYGLSKKRFRTRFSQEQKEKMTEFAERIGWRIQRQNEGEVQRFCDQLGVKRQVFKVWIHNNKQRKES